MGASAALQAILPVLVLVACGFLAGKVKAFGPEAFRAIGRFVLFFALPATIFNAISAHPLRAVLDPNYLIDYAAGSLIAFAIGYAIFLWARPKPASARAIFALGGAAANTGFIGYPVALQALGPVAGAAAGLTFVVETALVIPLALFLAEHGAQGSARGAFVEALRRVLSMPIIWAVAAGLAVSATGLPLPELARRPISFLAAASAPAGLFFVGGVLSGIEARAISVEPLLIGVCKLAIHPLAVWLMLTLLPAADPRMASAALIFASVSVITSYPLFGQPFGLERDNAVYLMLSTLIAAVTLPIVMSFLAR